MSAKIARSGRTVVRHGLKMRAYFDFSSYNLRSWYLRHMHTGMKQVHGKLHSIDGVIEVHDARMPFTGRNFQLSDIGILKPSLLVLSKIDLIDKKHLEKIETRLNADGQDVVFVNSKDPSDRGMKSIVPKLLEKMKFADRFNRTELPERNLMVLGIPNVGKSSLINSLRAHNMNRKKAAAVAPMPGVTRCVMERIKVTIYFI